MGTLWVLLGIWLVVCGATVGDPVASKSASALEHYQRGEYDQALQLYRDALLDRPDAPELHFNVGDALFKRGEYDQALRGIRARAQCRGAENPGAGPLQHGQ